MSGKKCILFATILLMFYKGYAQENKLTIQGEVFDEASESPLPFVNIFIQKVSKGAITDDKGYFKIDQLLAGEYHLIFSHIGCESKKIHLNLTQDTILHVGLTHTPTSLGTIVIEAKNKSIVNQPNLAVNRKSIEDNTNESLAGLLENETGVHLLKNGSGISKPVVHGLYGNRLTILNNGIVQSGQQWGNDHSPEIDPFSADKIVVVKGAGSIEFGGSNLGSAILVEPKPIARDPHLHGQINYLFETNGRGHILNTRFEKFSPFLAWRINGTLKGYGDRKTPDYYLNNSGIREANLAIQLEKSWEEKWFINFFTSTFNTRLGILRGSHIGNLTDLEQALTNKVPFFTEPDFRYAIDAPKQEVSHHLAKGNVRYYINEDQKMELTIAGQINNRKEFDVRRSGRTNIPALSLDQLTFNSRLQYSSNFSQSWVWKIGNQNTITDNTNRPETGILPLIPDYRSFENGLYSSLTKNHNQAQYDLGIRYNFEYQDVKTISNSIPREIIRYENRYHNIGGIAGAKFQISKFHSIALNSGFSMRNPAINELYSYGLHQGVSGIEEGDVDLTTEKVLKNTLDYKWLPNARFSFNALFYHQHFKNYIFLNPQDEFRLTIRGAFPLYRYEQTDASIYGLDAATQFTVGRSFFVLLRYSFIRGEDITNDKPLIYMPPNSFFGSLVYRAKHQFEISERVTVEDSEIELNNRLVFKQKNILPGQDFAPPPPAYSLAGLKVSSNFLFSNYRIRCFIKIDNLFNVRYRDYLNRQRYFADEPGRSISMGANFKF